MRDVKDMHWFLWEAIVMQARDMYSKGLLAESLMCDVNFVSTSAKRQGNFSLRARILACQIEEAMSKKEAEWYVLLEAEQEAMYAAEMC